MRVVLIYGGVAGSAGKAARESGFAKGALAKPRL